MFYVEIVGLRGSSVILMDTRDIFKYAQKKCAEEMFKICSDLDNCPCTLERKVNTDERDTFTEVLNDLAVTCQANISVFGSVCKCIFSTLQKGLS